MKYKKILPLLLAASGALNAQGEILYGLSQNTLFTFDSANPALIGGVRPITGLGGDSLLGIDFRPRGGALFGLGSSLRLFSIDTGTGAASLINGTPFGASSSTVYGFDFNPVPDAIRIVNDGGDNFRVSPSGNLLGNDGRLAYAVGDTSFGIDPSIAGAAYANNFDGATSTSLSAIDSLQDTLVRIAPPNAGVISTVGLLGVNTTSDTAFDISGTSGRAFASLTEPGDTFSGLYEINLQTGAATFIGDIGYPGTLNGLAAAVPEPGTWALMGLGFAAFVGSAMRRKVSRS